MTTEIAKNSLKDNEEELKEKTKKLSKKKVVRGLFKMALVLDT